MGRKPPRAALRALVGARITGTRRHGKYLLVDTNRPATRSHRLWAPAAKRLAAAIREVLDRALEHNGTSLRDFVDADGAEGNNADYLWVYGRQGEPCPRCATAIKRTVHQGRATFYCPTCQTP